MLLWEAWKRNSDMRLKKCTEGLPMLGLRSAEMKFGQWVEHCIPARCRTCGEPERSDHCTEEVEVEGRKSGHDKKGRREREVKSALRRGIRSMAF